MNMDPEKWERAKELFQAALELDSSKRASFLAKNCPDDDLRQQVEKLLVSCQEAGSFLDDPVLEPGISQGLDSAPKSQTKEASSLHRESIGLLATATNVGAEDPMVGRQLGDYKIVRRIGQGGMAAVFLAVRADDNYRKEVAIKLVQPGLDTHEQLSRFRNERQTLADLDHPNIVKLLDGGSTTDGLPFLVMDYVEGSPIDDYCDRHKLRIDERLQLFCKVCEAVEYAHEKSIVHRDLKPSNILVTADGIPRLLDFGIAKVLNPQPAAQSLVLTHTGMRCMTPAYASPEQMRGQSITTATDVYSLGVMLYELLTGHRPYRLTQHSPAEIERAICEQEPETPSTAVSRVETDTSSSGVPVTKTPELVSETREGQPDKLQRRLRGDLDNIVLKALQKEPERRYGSVEDFSLDIQRHLQHLPIQARPSTFIYRTSKFIQRHKIEVSAALIVILVLVAAVSFIYNTLGLRDRVLGGIPIAPKGALPARPRARAANGAASARAAAVSCESLAQLHLPDTTITVAQSVSAGAFTPPSTEPITHLPDFCRVEGMIKPTPDSNIEFEVWVPSVDWNGKLLAVGNWGFAGFMDFRAMAAALRGGYAASATDAGHRGDIVNTWDAGWALQSPDRVLDYGYRAVHEMTEKTKAVVRAFYGQAPQWSFFEGCSNGGREALMEAQRFPEDYQGILAGAPPISETHLLAAAVYNIHVPVLADPDSYIPASKFPAISAAVLAACDALDGVTDGILSDPRQCRFDPSVLRCRGAESDDCLNSAQVAQLKRIYAGLRNAKGEQLFPGYMPGGEEGEGGWKDGLTGSTPGQGQISTFGLNYFRYMVFGSPAWDYRTVSAERAVQIADERTAQTVNAADPDLRRFKAAGGKLMLYHGWSDPLIPGLSTVNYYDNVVARLGMQETEGFARLYMAPGMQHCMGGPGPNSFGQLPDFPQVSTDTDPHNNIFNALEQWVEKGTPPGPIIATKYVNDLDPAQGVKMTRPLCPYPQTAKYKGTGDTNDAANFVCTESDVQH
jgi:feruloyl esterase